MNDSRFGEFVKIFLNMIVVSVLILSVTSIANAEARESNIYPDRLGSPKNQDSQIETFTISIPQLGNRPRDIQVYLPPGYASGDQAYPVIYLGDGGFLFNPPSTALGDYQIDETMDRLTAEGKIDGMIVVGIEHDLNFPWDEYIPWVNENMHDWVTSKNSEPAEGGEGFAYLDFIVNTLKPEIDARYRSLADRENTYIGGFCRNALIPILAGLIYPEIFSGVLAMSPAVWMAEGGGAWLSNNQLINFINSAEAPQDVKFYIDIGTEESSGPRPPVRDQDGKRITYPQAYVEGATAVYQSLIEIGVPEENLSFQVVENAKGDRDAWRERFPFALLWLISGTDSPPSSSNTPLPDLAEPSTPEVAQEEDIQDSSPSGNRIPRQIILIVVVIVGLIFLPGLIAVIWLLIKK